MDEILQCGAWSGAVSRLAFGNEKETDLDVFVGDGCHFFASNNSNENAIKTILTLVKQSFVFVDQVSMIFLTYDYFSAVLYVVFLCVHNRVCRERNGLFVACGQESVGIFCDPDIKTGALCVFKRFVVFCPCFP